jgi:F-type H+-transporting ATPase subunit delta
VAKQFDTELNAQLGLVEAEISSSRPLSADGQRQLESQLERLTGKKVRATYSSRPELLGGVVVRVGSTIYDGSVRGQLEKMKQDLISA